MAGAGLLVLTIMAVPVAALSGGSNPDVQVDAADDRDGSTPPEVPATTTDPVPATDAGPEPSPAPTAPPETTTTRPSCASSLDERLDSHEDGGLSVEFVSSGSHVTLSCESSVVATGSADPAEVVVFDVDWGDGTVEGDPQPSIVCDGPSDERVEIEREFRHTYRESGRHEASVSATAYVCTDGGVVTDRVTFETTFTVDAA